MLNKNWNRLTAFVLTMMVMFFSSGSAPTTPGLSIPITSNPTHSVIQSDELLPSLEDFIAAISDQDTTGIRGIYVQDVMALRVAQQPLNDLGYVSNVEGVTTLFRQALLVNTIGLLAHNYAAGRYFSELKLDDNLQMIYGDGHYKTYQVTAVYRFQAIEPNNSNSSFIDLQTNEEFSAAQLFKQVYMGNHHITLQTCIQQGEEPSWGRLFIIAEPL